MNKTKSILLKISTALILTSVSLYLFAPWQFALFYLQPIPDSLTEQLQQATEQHIEGIVLYVDKKGEPANALASGWHDRDTNTPAKPDTLFKIGSISKLYTNVLLTKLHVNGVISLDKTLAHYLPTVAQNFDNADHITLKMMIQHRSGLANFTDHKNFDWGKEFNFEQAIKLAADMPNSFEPDTSYEYSNTNYFLLRKIMTDQLGHDYTKLIGTMIITPLQLKNTFYSVNDVDIERVMGGYHIGYEQNFNTLDQGLVASAQDVAIFIRALNEGTLFTPQENALYSELYGREHTGWVLGHSSIAKYDKALDTVIVLFTNTTGNDTVLLTQIIYSRILKIIKRQYS